VAQGEAPALSPDGKRVAYPYAGDYKHRPENGAALRVAEIATGKSVQLVAEELNYFPPAWSPDGQQLAFLTYPRGGRRQLELIRTDGSDRRVLIKSNEKDPREVFQVVWLPERQGLLFQDLNAVYRISPTGEVLERTLFPSIAGPDTALASSDRVVPCPTTPNLIAYTMQIGGPPKFEKVFSEPIVALYLYDATTKQRRRVGPTDALLLNPCWSHDGQRLYVYGFREPQYRMNRDRFRIYRVNRDGTGFTEVCAGERVSL